jgi:hypothetical protein
VGNRTVILKVTAVAGTVPDKAYFDQVFTTAVQKVASVK